MPAHLGLKIAFILLADVATVEDWIVESGKGIVREVKNGVPALFCVVVPKRFETAN